MRRMFANLIAKHPVEAASFYQKLFGLQIRFCSDWFVQLGSLNNEWLELGILREGHEDSVNLDTGPTPHIMLTFVVDDIDVWFAKAVKHGVDVVEEPRNMFYGQRRALVRDPIGTLLDVSSECPPDPRWRKRIKRVREGYFVEEPPPDYPPLPLFDHLDLDESKP
ncbi:MAG: glyoxalase [Deltaproteobacteria bacterium]|nr:MAG: glyoxalase [Deltaproteobacteria bacterium]